MSGRGQCKMCFRYTEILPIMPIKVIFRCIDNYELANDKLY